MTDCAVQNFVGMIITILHMDVERHGSKNVYGGCLARRQIVMPVICGFVKIVEGILTV